MTHQKTFESLHEWTNAMFEKLGWMVLAERDGNVEKIVNYVHSIERLLEDLDYKITKVEDKDRKHDLKILRDNVLVLQEHVMRDFGKHLGEKMKQKIERERENIQNRMTKKKEEKLEEKLRNKLTKEMEEGEEEMKDVIKTRLAEKKGVANIPMGRVIERRPDMMGRKLKSPKELRKEEETQFPVPKKSPTKSPREMLQNKINESKKEESGTKLRDLLKR